MYERYYILLCMYDVCILYNMRVTVFIGSMCLCVSTHVCVCVSVSIRWMICVCCMHTTSW